MIRTNNLKKVYLTEEVETTALDNVNVEIKEKEFVAIMGPSGCGKSTLLNLLGMLDNPTDGQVRFFLAKRFQNIPNASVQTSGSGILVLCFRVSI